MPDVLNSRAVVRRKKRGGSRRSPIVAPIVDETAAADPEGADIETVPPQEQPHRPWLVPGAGKL